MQKPFKYYLLFLLIGYSLFGKGFAYIHIPSSVPIYLGEIGFIIGFAMLIVNVGIIRKSINNPIIQVYVLFALFGFSRAVIDIFEYGIDTIRDSAIWYYGIYSFLVATIIRSKLDILTFVKFYKKFTLVLLYFIPLYIIIVIYFGITIPKFPNSPVPIIYPKFGDLGVHLAGATCFVLLFSSYYNKLNRVQLYILIGVGLVIIASVNRGGFVAAVISVFLISILFFKFFAITRVLIFIIVSIALFYMLNINIYLGHRSISSQQFLLNVASIIKLNESPSELAGTVHWRLLFWSEILRNLNLFGVGFGRVLADVYRFPYVWEMSDVPILRNAHNSHLTILARMGILGFLLWVMLLYIYFSKLFHTVKTSNSQEIKKIAGWLIGYTTASLINAVFDPSLESPMGGIWFWVLIGLGAGLSYLKFANRTNENRF